MKDENSSSDLPEESHLSERFELPPGTPPPFDPAIVYPEPDPGEMTRHYFSSLCEMAASPVNNQNAIVEALGRSNFAPIAGYIYAYCLNPKGKRVSEILESNLIGMFNHADPYSNGAHYPGVTAWSPPAQTIWAARFMFGSIKIPAHIAIIVPQLPKTEGRHFVWHDIVLDYFISDRKLVVTPF